MAPSVAAISWALLVLNLMIRERDGVTFCGFAKCRRHSDDPALPREPQTRRYLPRRLSPFNRHDKAIGTTRPFCKLGQVNVMSYRTMSFELFNYLTI